MFSALTLALLAVTAPVPPGAGQATDLTPIFPDGAVAAMGIDIKGVMNSPLGKKVVGDDKPFDAARKILKVLFPVDGLLPVEGDAGKAVAAVANRLNRATIAYEPKNNGFVIYLEGEITEDDYLRAAEELAKSSMREFKTEKLGERKVAVVGEGGGTVYGLRLSEALFLIVYRKELLDEILEKYAAKKVASLDKLLVARLKTVKTAETPVWLVIGELKVEGGASPLNDLSGLVATISLKADADIRITGDYATEEQAEKTKGTLNGVLPLLQLIGEESQMNIWQAAKIGVKRDGKTVTAAGSIPAKLLAEHYAQQK